MRFAMLLTTGHRHVDVYVMQCSVLCAAVSALQDHTLRRSVEHAALFDFMDGTLGTRRGECYLRPATTRVSSSSSAPAAVAAAAAASTSPPPPSTTGCWRSSSPSRSSSSSMKLALPLSVCALWT